MRTIKIDNFTIIEIAENIAKIYPYPAERIHNLILQVRSLDLTLDVIEACMENNDSLDYGVYCVLKGKDENQTSIKLEIKDE